MPTVSKRPGPNGQSVWQVQIRRLGHRPQYRTFNRRAVAEAWARKTETDLQNGDWVDRSEGDRTTVRQALERYRLEVVPHKAPATRKRELQRIVKMQDSDLAKISLSRLTARDVSNYVRGRVAVGVGGNALQKEVAFLSHMYTIAMGPWGMAYLTNPVPLARIAMPPVPRGRMRRLIGDEEVRLLSKAPAGFAPVIKFALATAMRRGEIANLRWQDVDQKKRVLLIKDTKNHEPRSVPLAPSAVQVLRKLPETRAGSVFGLRENTITQNMIKACQRAGIDDLNFHDLRHEAISRLFEDTDLDTMEIKAISGHKSPLMLSRYTHLRTARLVERLAGMGRTGKAPSKRRRPSRKTI